MFVFYGASIPSLLSLTLEEKSTNASNSKLAFVEIGQWHAKSEQKVAKEKRFLSFRD